MFIIKKIHPTWMTFCFCLFAHFAFAQCIDDTHSNHPEDSWLSCQTSISPNPERGNVHWTLYDLGYVYTLGKTTIWNYNVEGETQKGFKAVTIDYSLNGTDWIHAGSFELEEATGDNNYTGYTDFEFGDVEGRYILLTAQSNWGGSGCTGLSEFKVEVGDPLPLELLSFDAVPDRDKIILNWASIDESGFSHFDLERSTDGVNFQFLGKIQGTNSLQKNLYDWIDTQVEKGVLYYYRLKMNDLDGTYEYSSIETAELDGNNTFHIYPNPSKDVLHVSFQDEIGAEIIIRNATGHELYRIEPTQKVHYIDTSMFAAGVYWCSISGKGQNLVTKRFIKIN